MLLLEKFKIARAGRATTTDYYYQHKHAHTCVVVIFATFSVGYQVVAIIANVSPTLDGLVQVDLDVHVAGRPHAGDHFAVGAGQFGSEMNVISTHSVNEEKERKGCG